MQDLYEHADRPLPDYFPTEPAEQAYDTGRERWRNLIDREDVEIAKDSDTLQVTFPESMNFELHEYKRDPPMTVRIEKSGARFDHQDAGRVLRLAGETTTGDPRRIPLTRS